MDVVHHVDKVIIDVYILLNNVYRYSMYVQVSVRAISPISQPLQKNHRTKSNSFMLDAYESFHVKTM